MPLKKVIDLFNVGRRYTSSTSNSLLIDVVEEGPFYLGFNLSGPDAEHVNRLMSNRITSYETIAFYTGALSHPLNVLKFLRDYIKTTFP